MRSMYRSYSTELIEEDKKTGEKTKTGKFVVTRSSAYQAGLEVLGTHKGLKGAELTKYMETYFERTWNHYDVMQRGWVDVEVMPMMMRFLASDQLIHIYGQAKVDTYSAAPIPSKTSKDQKANKTETAKVSAPVAKNTTQVAPVKK